MSACCCGQSPTKDQTFDEEGLLVAQRPLRRRAELVRILAVVNLTVWALVAAETWLLLR